MLNALGSWVTLNEAINKFNEKELRIMLKYELLSEKRSAFIKRIKQKIIVVHSKEFKEQLDKVGAEDGEQNN